MEMRPKMKPYWSTPKGVTHGMYEEVLSIPEYNQFIHRKRRNKRVRGMMACMVYFDMKMDDKYIGKTLREFVEKYNPVGASAILLSSQKVGSLLAMMVRLGILSKSTKNNKSYYRRLI